MLYAVPGSRHGVSSCHLLVPAVSTAILASSLSCILKNERSLSLLFLNLQAIQNYFGTSYSTCTTQSAA
jgi:hypothetical protein